ncbi:Uma2 family endonuclease [Candidatus Poribacteria bacterium]|nr:Uma2 family endonuclease [Candidatus Poribacteria bacterium]MYH79647.1 Uma2 family endonuclease [Candidatus Poribacteria bacterium]MYK96198.1 Uma2 family endonuclease [Candidatus Poribacteria bacterium]
MAPIAAPTYLTPEAYLELERKAIRKNEYVNGEPLAMAGASFAHNFITFDTAIHLNNQLMDTECQVASTGDLRVKVAETESYFYPDIVVVCGEPRAEDNVFDTLLNPTVIVEVLSASTEMYDRDEKFTHCRQIDSLQEYILISEDKVQVLRYRRDEPKWVPTEFRTLADVVPLLSNQCELPLQQVYKRVKFDNGNEVVTGN